MRGPEAPFFVPIQHVKPDTTAIQAHVEQALPALAADTYVVDVEHHGGTEPAIHLLVDTDAGITLGACVELNRALRPQLEEAGLLPEEYAFEVSSPGVGTPLRLPRQYTKNIGRSVLVTLNDGSELDAVLQGVSETHLHLDVYLPTRKGQRPKTQAKELAFTEVAQTVVTVSFAKPKKQKAQKKGA